MKNIPSHLWILSLTILESFSRTLSHPLLHMQHIHLFLCTFLSIICIFSMILMIFLYVPPCFENYKNKETILLVPLGLLSVFRSIFPPFLELFLSISQHHILSFLTQWLWSVQLFLNPKSLFFYQFPFTYR